MTTRSEKIAAEKKLDASIVAEANDQHYRTHLAPHRRRSGLLSVDAKLGFMHYQWVNRLGQKSTSGRYVAKAGTNQITPIAMI